MKKIIRAVVIGQGFGLAMCSWLRIAQGHPSAALTAFGCVLSVLMTVLWYLAEETP